jgi:hypothetical protein
MANIIEAIRRLREQAPEKHDAFSPLLKETKRYRDANEPFYAALGKVGQIDPDLSGKIDETARCVRMHSEDIHYLYGLFDGALLAYLISEEGDQ